MTYAQLVNAPVGGNWMFAATLVPSSNRSAVPALVPAYRKVRDLGADESNSRFQWHNQTSSEWRCPGTELSRVVKFRQCKIGPKCGKSGIAAISRI